MPEPEPPLEPSQPPAVPIQLAPLKYFEQQSEPWIPLVVALSWTMTAIYGLYVAAWVLNLACYLGQTALNLPSRVLRPEMLYTEMVAAVFSAIICYCAFGCLRFRESHRTALVSFSRIMLVVAPLTDLAMAVQYINRIGPFNDPLGALAYGSRYGLAGAANMVLPLLVIAMFNRSEVRSLFR